MQSGGNPGTSGGNPGTSGGQTHRTAIPDAVASNPPPDGTVSGYMPTGPPTSSGITGYSGHPQKPLGTDQDFALILIAIAIYVLSVQLFNVASKIQGWVLADEKDAPAPESGWVAVVVSTLLIITLCFLRATFGSFEPNLLIAFVVTHRDFAIGLLVASMVPSGLAASKLIGI